VFVLRIFASINNCSQIGSKASQANSADKPAGVEKDEGSAVICKNNENMKNIEHSFSRHLERCREGSPESSHSCNS
jgi:hypothetical protein